MDRRYMLGLAGLGLLAAVVPTGTVLAGGKGGGDDHRPPPCRPDDWPPRFKPLGLSPGD